MYALIECLEKDPVMDSSRISCLLLLQAVALKLELGGSQRKQAYMQMDGEPWKQPLSNIHSTVIEIARVPYLWNEYLRGFCFVFLYHVLYCFF